MTRSKVTLNICSKSKVACGLLLCMCLACFVIYFLCLLPSKESKHSAYLDASKLEVTNENPPPNHTLCVLVPFRDVFEELLEFVPHMSTFLHRQSINFHIAVINHVPDGNRFNKGSAYNAGFKIISKEYADCDYIALHDIDLLPLNHDLSYGYPGHDVFHVANPDYHPLGEYYMRDLYIGGIAIISNQQFIRVNGFGNNFWGWGFEDQNFSLRLKKNSIRVNRPTDLSTDRNNTFKHIHRTHRKRDLSGCLNQLISANGVSDYVSGIHDVNYEIISRDSLIINGFPSSLFNVNIPCNYTATPWCKPYCLGGIDMQQSGK
ncbi:xylosylprotein 4-beta-galactosyltransferase-like [Planococcus citri]|uniref:xylosylprotein 4-beta-galactosyltransferase-like n=1 Tax=Planococcus citri TaxID=170843 RepID=UPI0031F9CD02